MRPRPILLYDEPLILGTHVLPIQVLQTITTTVSDSFTHCYSYMIWLFHSLMGGIRSLVSSVSHKLSLLYPSFYPSVDIYFIGFLLICGCLLGMIMIMLDYIETSLVTKKQWENKVHFMKKQLANFTSEHELIFKELELVKNDLSSYDHCIQKIKNKVKKLEKEIALF